MTENKMNLEVNIGELKLKNPFMVASGTAGYGEELTNFGDLSKLGAFIGKTITREPREGNPTPRIVETAAGMINSIGLANDGIDEFIAKKLPTMIGYGANLIVNIAGNTVEDYVELTEKLDPYNEIAALEINISCPNVKKGGLAFGADPNETFRLVQTIRPLTKKPLIIKLTPNVTNIADIAVRAEEAGADALTVANTYQGMAIDVHKRTPSIKRIIGGLSGPAIKPISLRCVYQTVQSVKIPVIGCGGICSVEDAIEYLIAGASAVQIGTWNFIQPADVYTYPEQLAEYLKSQNMSFVSELIGSLITD